MNNHRQQRPQQNRQQQQPSQALATVPPPDFSAVTASQNSRAVFLPANLGQAMELAHFMAGGIGVRAWMRGNPSACLALIQISMRWGLDPYIVANKAYYANDTLSFESQLVNAVINTGGGIIGRLKVEFEGDANGKVGEETLVCRVSGRLLADPDQLFTHEQELKRVKIRNSPLWQVNPKQQLQYHATRAWARLYMPEVLLGIYTPDEIEDGTAERLAAETTPRDATPAPDRRQFAQSEEPKAEEVEDAEIEEVEDQRDQVVSRDTESAVVSDGDDTMQAGDTDNAASVVAQGVTEGDNVEPGAADNGQAGNTLFNDQPGSEADASAQADAVSTGGPGPASDGAVKEADPLASLAMVAAKEGDWDEWQKAAFAAIDGVADRGEFEIVQRRLEYGLNACPKDIADQVDDALTDQFLKLPEKK